MRDLQIQMLTYPAMNVCVVIASEYGASWDKVFNSFCVLITEPVFLVRSIMQDINLKVACK